jgi:hypothetical protein
MAASITASLLAAVSFTVTVSSLVTVSRSSGSVSLIHISTLIPIIGIQDPTAATKSDADQKARLSVRDASQANMETFEDQIRDRTE